MSSSDYREPTNDQLWAQPPAVSQPSQGPQGLAPVPPPPVPTPVHYAPPPVPVEHPDRTVFALAIVSIGVGIPLTAIAGSVGGIPGLLIAWIGIVLVNAIYARSRRGN